jgi:uncharacterized protein YcfL
MKSLLTPVFTSALILLSGIELPARSQDKAITLKKGDILLDGKLTVADLGATDGKAYSVVLQNTHSDNLAQKVIVRWYDKKGRLVRKGPIQWRTLQIEQGKAVRLTAPAPFVVSAAVEFR